MTEESAAHTVAATNYSGWHRPSDWRPITVVRAEGCTFWDSEGRSYLDFASQLVNANLGHGNPRIVEAIRAQAETLAYVAPGFATEVRARLSRSLRRVLPAGLGRFFFSTSGTEANEAALRMARIATGRSRVLALRRSYHGSTSASLSVSGDLRRRAAGTSSEVPGTTFVPECYCYRCPLKLTYPDCGVACADATATALEEGPEAAALIVEPVIGTNGVIVPVPEYLPKLRAITRKHGTLLIADEVMTGWGRVGDWFAVQRFGIEPDLLTTAKGITGAAAPLALTATTKEVEDRLGDRMLPLGHTYEAHPIGLSAGVAAIEEYERLGLPRRSREEGEHLLRRLRELADRHPSVGEVRGIGLFAAVELVRDRTTRTPFNTEDEVLSGRPTVANAVVRSMADQGVYAFSWVSHLVLAPPLIIPRDELDRGIDVLDKALWIADERAR
ncbi:MAG TPA: aspartate aminotransferase family protein [Thermoplasmata archaeon]|nr:aspartate aminotransferase family protein [Thermoplasmata archaeon]